MSAAEPWKNDPVVQADPAGAPAKAPADAPWASDPIVQPTNDKAKSKGHPGRYHGEDAPNAVVSGLGGAANNLLPGWMDEIAGHVGAVEDYLTNRHPGEDYWDRYYQAKKDYGEGLNDAYDAHPVAYGAGAVAGTLAGGFALPEVKAAEALGVAGRGARFAVNGAATGSVYGGLSGLGEGDTPQEGLTNALHGLAFGAGAGLLGGSIAGKFDSRVADRVAARAAADLAAENAQRSASDLPVPMTLSRGVATGDGPTQQFENLATTGAFGPKAMRSGEAHLANTYDGLGANADAINERIAGQHPVQASPLDAGTDLSAQLQAHAARNDAAANAEMDSVRRSFTGKTGVDTADAREGLQSAIAGVVQREEDAHNTVGAAYDAAARIPGYFEAKGIDGIDHHIRNALATAPVPVAVTDLTPAAKHALDYLGKIENFKTNYADPRGAPPASSIVQIDPMEIDQVRKYLNSLWRQTEIGSEDRRAMGAIKRAYDARVIQAVQDGFYHGDTRVLAALEHARKSNADFMSLFHPDSSNPGRRIMNEILKRDATAEQASRILFSNGSFNGPDAAHAANQLKSVLGNGSDEWAALQQAGIHTLMAHDGDLNAATAGQIADRIQNFTGGRGRSLAEALYEQPHIDRLNTIAQNLRTFAKNKNMNDSDLKILLDIGRGQMDGNSLANALKGGSPKQPVNTTKAVRYLNAINNTFGADSREMANVKQILWQHVTNVPEGATPKGARTLANNISGLLASPAGQHFTGDVRRAMENLRDTAARVAGNANAKNPPNTAANLLSALYNNAEKIGGMIGFVHGGNPISVGAGWLFGEGAKKVVGTMANRAVKRSLAGQEVGRGGALAVDKALRGGQRVGQGLRQIAPTQVGANVLPAMTSASAEEKNNRR
jgi:hypothetical protein